MSDSSDSYSLLTDQYQLTMAAAYFHNGQVANAAFSLFIREYPEDRGYFVSAGLEMVLDYLESFRFHEDELDYLKQTGLFRDDFLHHLSDLRFTGTVRAMPEGRIFFKDEPVLEVTGPIIEAQLVETFIINAVNLQSMIAGKAARCVQAARGAKLVDFSLRRCQGTDAGLKVARASYLGGFGGTSNVLAGKRYGVPVAGTMAHSFVTSFEHEEDSFRAFAETFPNNTVLLIDTYDTVSGAHKAVEIAKEMAEKGEQLRGVRLDSGDMVELSKEVRKVLDSAGFTDVSIFASGGFDEFKIDRYMSAGALIDAFGVGTKMGVSADAPYFDIAYKLVQYNGRPVLKLSSGKKTLVGEKQVYRHEHEHNFIGDTIALKDEALEGEALLIPVMENGERLGAPEDLDTVRERLQKDLSRLPDAHKRLREPELYKVQTAPGLTELQARVTQQVREKELGES
jgi:nicotinate phosphoribosyltransferase